MSKSSSFNIHDYLPSDSHLVLGLAFVGGYVDCVGYLLLSNIFTSSITGNVVVACASMHSLEGVLCRFLVTLSFTLSAAINTAISIRMKLMKYSPHIIYPVLYSLEFLSLLAALIIGESLIDEIKDHFEDPNYWAIILVATIMGASMGFHNGAAKESIPNCPSTTVMTMTLVSIASFSSNTLGYYLASLFDGYDLLQSEVVDDPNNQMVVKHKNYIEKYQDAKQKLKIPIESFFSFVIGAVVGAVITARGEANFLSLIIPLFIEILFMLTFFLRGYCAVKPQREEPKPISAPPPKVVEEGPSGIEMIEVAVEKVDADETLLYEPQDNKEIGEPDAADTNHSSNV